MDEIDALSRPSTVKPEKVKGKPATRRQPRSGQSSREPSRPSSVASERLSVAETTLHKPDYEVPPLAHEYIWTSPPTDVTTLPGYVYVAHAEKTLHVDDDDVSHFIKRGDVDINDLSNQLDVLLSGNSSWKTIYHAITDLFQFDSIVGTRSDFICLLIGLARSWDDDAECNPAGIVKTLINDASALVKTEEELHIAQTALSRIRNERNQAMTDVRKLVDTVDRLRKDRNTLKTTMEDIVGKGGVAPTTAQFEGIQAELALLKDENSRLNKVIEHDKNALRAAEEENAAFTLQVSLMNEDFDDKNAVIEALESASVEMMKEHGKLEIAHMSLKAELEAAKAVILTMRMHQESEQKVYESRISRLKAWMDENPSTESNGISKELAVAKERIAFLEKAYKDKSDALKKASQSPKKPGPASNTAKSTAKPDAPKWGFEPPDDLPRSQPYWDYRNAYSDHIAAMVAATVTAIPHIPLSSAISTAMSTVSKAGPPPQLSKSGKRGQSGSATPSGPPPLHHLSPPHRSSRNRAPLPSSTTLSSPWPRLLRVVPLSLADLKRPQLMRPNPRKPTLGAPLKQASRSSRSQVREAPGRLNFTCEFPVALQPQTCTILPALGWLTPSLPSSTRMPIAMKFKLTRLTPLRLPSGQRGRTSSLNARNLWVKCSKSPWSEVFGKTSRRGR